MKTSQMNLFVFATIFVAAAARPHGKFVDTLHNFCKEDIAACHKGFPDKDTSWGAEHAHPEHRGPGPECREATKAACPACFENLADGNRPAFDCLKPCIDEKSEELKAAGCNFPPHGPRNTRGEEGAERAHPEHRGPSPECREATKAACPACFEKLAEGDRPAFDCLKPCMDEKSEELKAAGCNFPPRGPRSEHKSGGGKRPARRDGHSRILHREGGNGREGKPGCFVGKIKKCFEASAARLSDKCAAAIKEAAGMSVAEKDIAVTNMLSAAEVDAFFDGVADEADEPHHHHHKRRRLLCLLALVCGVVVLVAAVGICAVCVRRRARARRAALAEQELEEQEGGGGRYFRLLCDCSSSSHGKANKEKIAVKHLPMQAVVVGQVLTQV